MHNWREYGCIHPEYASLVPEVMLNAQTVQTLWLPILLGNDVRILRNVSPPSRIFFMQGGLNWRYTYPINMSLYRSSFKIARTSPWSQRLLSTGRPCLTTKREHPNVDGHRKIQKEKPLTPHITSTTSTISNEMPSAGSDKAPPDLLSSVDPDFVPKDTAPENTEHMTGKTQKGIQDDTAKAELGVGEMEGAKFKVEPLRRTGEDPNTMRARLLCPLFTVISTLVPVTLC